MKYGRVVGQVVCTVKHPSYFGRTVLMVQPMDEHGRDAGASLLAIDDVQSGPGDHVLVLQEGLGIRQLMGTAELPVDALIVGIVDAVDRSAPRSAS